MVFGVSKKNGPGNVPWPVFHHSPTLNLVGVNDQPDLLSSTYCFAKPLVPFADVGDGHIVTLRYPHKRFTASDAVEDLLLFAVLPHRQIADLMIFPINVDRNEQVFARGDAVFPEAVDVAYRLRLCVV